MYTIAFIHLWYMYTLIVCADRANILSTKPKEVRSMTKREREEYRRLFKEGTIGIPFGKGETKIAHWWAKVYDEGSAYGINEGRISKLMIKIDGKTTLSYDRGWDIEPDENDQATMVVYSIILQEYN